jgi:3-oxoacyl-[acyl-carrier-protein] synthase II
MVAGGCESAVEALGLGGFGKLRALSDTKLDGENEDYSSAAQASSRPFDTKRNGFVLAEGAAMLVLEEYNHAIARGAPILAEVIGVGYSGDAFHITAPEPTGEGAARAMQHALEDAGNCMSMDDVDYVNAHATSTPMGDVAEINAIRMALSRTTSETKHVSPLLVSSTKGATGHLLGAAGSLEAALTIRAVSEDRVPHTRNLDAISEDIVKALGPTSDDALTRRSIQLVQHEPITQTINIAMSNSFGFGGTNVSLLFRKAK